VSRTQITVTGDTFLTCSSAKLLTDLSLYASEQALDALDKMAMHGSTHALSIHKVVNIAVKAGHTLDAFAMHHPAAVGLSSVAIVAGVTWSHLHFFSRSAEEEEEC
jgi:hypothetical protein